MLRIGVLWLVSTVLGVVAGVAILIAVSPERHPASPPLSQQDLEKFDPNRWDYHPKSILCFFSNSTRQGDPVGYFPADRCDPDPPSLSQDLATVVTLGDDGFVRVADVEALQAAHRHAGTIRSWQSRSKPVSTEVLVLRDVDISTARTTCVNRVCQHWHQPRMAAMQSISAFEEVLVEHWDEIERRLPAQRQATRSLEENLAAIIEGQPCNVGEYFRDATLAVVASARTKEGRTSAQLRNDAVTAIAEVCSNLMSQCLDSQQGDLCKMLQKYDELERTTPDVSDRIREILLQYVALEAKYQDRRRVPISKYQVWTALQCWPEASSSTAQ
jgi:hypothetical protein